MAEYPNSARASASSNAGRTAASHPTAAAASVAAPVKEEQLLTLKVMRLTKPSLTTTMHMSCEASDLPEGIDLTTKNTKKLSMIKDLPNFALGDTLGLPQSFGSIFLGEVFSSYLSVHNESEDTALEVTVSAELQTGNDRSLVTPSDVTPIALDSKKSMDIIVKHEVKELGTHLLVCTVSYKTKSGEAKSFRKFFRFQVYKPLDIKTMVYNIDNDILLEAQIQNITQSPMFIESVKAFGNGLFSITDFNMIVSEDDQTPKTTFDAMRYLNPQDVRQYLYCLSAIDKSKSDQVMAATSIGKLEIVWRTSLGELGRLQTNPLPRMPIVGHSLGVDVVEAPSEATFGEVFSIVCSLTNKTTAPMDLSVIVTPEKAGNIELAGFMNRHLEKLEAGASLDMKLDLIALSTGLQSIRGVGVLDSETKKVHELSVLPQIFVQSC